MLAFQEKLSLFREQNAQVLGISVDDPAETAPWAKKVGITFPLLSDPNGELLQQFGFFEGGRASRAVAAVQDGKILYSAKVTSTEIPGQIRPWVEQVIGSAG